MELRRKWRRTGAAGGRIMMQTPTKPNERWSMDFVTDSLVTGERFEALAIVDDYSREYPAIEIDTSLGGRRVIGVPQKLSELSGLTEVISVDNGPEFAGKALENGLTAAA